MKGNLLKSLGAISTMTFISRVLGFIREHIVIRVFGVGIESDAFVQAFKLPNLLRRIFAEGAFSQAFVPILAEYKVKEGEEATRIFVAYIAGILTLILAFITLLGILFAPYIIYVTAPGFLDDNDKFALASSLLKITFPYIFLISLSSMCGAILNTWNQFKVPAFTPTLLNISMIGGALFLSPYVTPAINALAISVVIGGILQLAYQLPYLYKIGMLVLPRVNLKHKGVWQVLRKMVPAIVGVSAGQISLILNGIFASFLITGSMSWMYYADRLMEFPAGILGVALGTILLPSLSKQAASNDTKQFSSLLDWGLRLCLLLSLPAALALCLLAEALTVTLYQYDKVTAFDSLMISKALMAYSLGLLAFIMIKVLAPGFYAKKDIKTPVVIAIISVVITQIMNLILVGPLGHVGLSLSIGIGALVNATLLFVALRKKKYYQPSAGWLTFLLKLVIAVSAMGLVILSILQWMPDWQFGNFAERIARLLLVVVLGAGSYFLVLIMLGFRIKDFTKKSI
ncbi:murein biosynthesis integral membrane protein MurJ [Thorsellia kenyensis]|uniref:Probable lipid II flippase MurJ n=1 Tax=Thorsellia kenyensis TaxID=1549888 RepID=A0ABV6CDN4_9GAMM